jgi:hypothetical protein
MAWIAVLGAGVGPAWGGDADRAASLAAWDKAVAVFQSPRCLDCHQRATPLQGDHGRQHLPRVERGPDNLGVTGMRCTSCHSQSGNNPSSGVPGADGWSLAPDTMVWQGVSSGALCRMLQDKALNGNRTPAALIAHLDGALVQWGWQPGAGRSTPPLSHADFVREMKHWVAGGSACPDP